MAWMSEIKTKNVDKLEELEQDLFWHSLLPNTLTFWDDKLPKHSSIKELLESGGFYLEALVHSDSSWIVNKNAPKKPFSAKCKFTCRMILVIPLDDKRPCGHHYHLVPCWNWCLCIIRNKAYCLHLLELHILSWLGPDPTETLWEDSTRGEVLESGSQMCSWPHFNTSSLK